MRRHRWGGRLWLLLATLVATTDADAEQVAAGPTPGDFGGAGLFQLPTAEMGAEGDVSGFASFETPYHRFGAAVTILPWAEFTARFTQIAEVPYGPASFSGNQSYLDRGLDARLRLIRQGNVLPDITLGLRDIAGNGLFDAEYLAATGSFDDLDVTLGLGWGQLASDHMFGNPLAFLAGSTRPAAGSAGTLRTDYFSGPSMALFGGVRLQTPLPGVAVEFEFNSNDYRDDPFRAQTHVRADSPVDLGVVYRPTSWIVLSAAFERGNTAMFKLALLGNLAETRPVKGPEPPADAAGDQHPAPESDADDGAVIRDLMLQSGWRLVSHRDDGGTRYATIAWTGTAAAPIPAEAIGRAARSIARLDKPVDRVVLTYVRPTEGRTIALDTRTLELAVAETGQTAPVVDAALAEAPSATHSPADPATVADAEIARKIGSDLDSVGVRLISLDLNGVRATIRLQPEVWRVATRAIAAAERAVLPDLPPEIALVTFGIVQDGVDIADVSLVRHELQTAFAGDAGSAELLHYATFASGAPAPADAIALTDAYPALDYALRPGLKTDTAGPDGLLLYDLDARLRADLAIAPGISIGTELAASLASDFDRLTLPSDSVLPHVRSDIAQYLRDGKYGIARLEADLVREPAPDLYGRISAGLLEDMFGGVDAETLYRPYGQTWAVGIDVNHVWQRGFHERFAFRPYQVSTAIAEAYLETGWHDLTLGVQAGRYLAGDAGGTLQLWRDFASGVRIGAFATVTTASGHQFGEGRFDKGVFVSIPLDWLIGYASRDTFDYTYRPVIRDGGQLIETAKPLYAVTDGAEPDQLLRDWPDVTR